MESITSMVGCGACAASTGFFRKRELKKKMSLSSQGGCRRESLFDLCVFENEGTEEPWSRRSGNVNFGVSSVCGWGMLLRMRVLTEALLKFLLHGCVMLW